MLQALTEAGIRPDLLIGTSVGAVNAAWIGGKPDHEGSLRLGEIWRSLRRQHIFPLSPWSSARGLLGRSNHVRHNTSIDALLRQPPTYQRLDAAQLPFHDLPTHHKTARTLVIPN